MLYTLIVGGTVDITVHQVVGETGLKEVASASGGNWGGTNVDDAFGSFIKDLVGKDVYHDFTGNHHEDLLEMFRSFEIKKRSVTAKSESDVVMTLPISLIEIYADANGASLDDDVKREDVMVTKNKLRLKASTFRIMFRETCDNIAKHVTKLLDDEVSSGVNAIIMVGGFSESDILQNTIRKWFSHLKVFVPRDASLCVLKGAVMYGHNPKIISERVVRYTYGTSVFKLFEEGVDPASKKMQKERGYVCKDVFSKHVQKSQAVRTGEPQKERRYRPLRKNQKKMCLPIFASEFRNPKYVTDPGCIQIGTVEVDMPCASEGLARDVIVAFTFSGTEISVCAHDRSSGNVSHVVVDLLS